MSDLDLSVSSADVTPTVTTSPATKSQNQGPTIIQDFVKNSREDLGIDTVFYFYGIFLL